MNDWDGTERRKAVRIQEIRGLVDEVKGLRKDVNDLSKRLDRQWVSMKRKRIASLMWVAIIGTLFIVAAAQVTDHHVKECMTFGSVRSEADHRWCNTFYPFHDHPEGGISDKILREEVERAIRLRTDQEAHVPE